MFYRQTAVYDNGDSRDYSYADNGARYTSTTEIDSNNDAVWSRQTSYYTADGQRITHVSQLNDDGTVENTHYDVAGAAWAGAAWQSYTDYRGTDGRIYRQTGLSDTGDRWDHQWDNGHGNVGAYSYGYIDANNDEWFRSYSNKYDTSGERIIQQNGTDDLGDSWQWIWENGYGNAGSSERIDWDTSGTKPWWHEVADYNAANQLTRFETYYDDNTKVVDNYSNDANAGWTKRTDIFNAAGALSSQTYT